MIATNQRLKTGSLNSIMQRMRHTAGSDTDRHFKISLNLVKAGFNETKSDLLSRFIEFWCQKNCQYEWRVEETTKMLTVSFDSTRDVVLFRISEEYDYFMDNSPIFVSQFTRH